MITVFAQTDKIMLKLMVGNSATGVYSAANTSALMVSFVFAAIINSVRPEIYKNRKVSQEKYEKSLAELYSVIIYASIFVCIAMSMFAPLIINIMYGAEFSSAVGVLRIAVWMTVFSYLGSVRDIWVLAENKQKYLWFIYFLSAILNVALNFLLIPTMKESGAALASVATQIFANFVIGFILKPFYKNNVIMIKSLNPKHIKDMLSSLKK
jgi:O-antigen/teichoic acid export membrane protein